MTWRAQEPKLHDYRCMNEMKLLIHWDPTSLYQCAPQTQAGQRRTGRHAYQSFWKGVATCLRGGEWAYEMSRLDLHLFQSETLFFDIFCRRQIPDLHMQKDKADTNVHTHNDQGQLHKPVG